MAVSEEEIADVLGYKAHLMFSDEEYIGQVVGTPESDKRTKFAVAYQKKASGGDRLILVYTRLDPNNIAEFMPEPETNEVLIQLKTFRGGGNYQNYPHLVSDIRTGLESLDILREEL